MLVIVIGRGNGGTRLISHTLSESGVFMGRPQNRAGDLLPPEPLYEAARMVGERVELVEDGWDFSNVIGKRPPRKFRQLVRRYLESLRQNGARKQGWKLPETTLAFPWIARMYPDAKYIYWVRNPRDSMLSKHRTDDLARFGVKAPDLERILSERYEPLVELAVARATVPVPSVPTADASWTALDELTVRLRRTVSWLYQHRLVDATPKPRNWVLVRYEDFVFDQEATLATLEAFLGLTLKRLPVSTEPIGRWQRDDFVSYFDILHDPMLTLGYPVPSD